MESQIGIAMNIAMFRLIWGKNCKEIMKDVEMTEDEARIVANILNESSEEILQKIKEHNNAKKMPGM